MAELTKEVQEQVSEFYSLQTQMQFVQYQKQQYKMQLDETDMALDELRKSEGEVYKSAGIVMIKSTKDEATKDLSEKKEVLGVRLNSLAKQEDKVRERLEELQKKIEGATKKKL
ncbi:MAG: prefoldin subunit beta [Candidatus Micrarchaeia archaeon]